MNENKMAAVMRAAHDVVTDVKFRAGSLVCLGAAAMMPMAGAVDGSGANAVVSAITSNVESLKGDAVTVIGAAVGLGVVFWGAKLLWSKFKSMAK